MERLMGDLLKRLRNSRSVRERNGRDPYGEPGRDPGGSRSVLGAAMLRDLDLRVVDRVLEASELAEHLCMRQRSSPGQQPRRAFLPGEEFIRGLKIADLRQSHCLVV